MTTTTPQSPYWGNLDPAVAVAHRQNSVRHSLTNEKNKERSGQDQSQLSPSLPQSRHNRISTLSQAPTASTQSPFASPVASSFQGDGPAPQPPSFPYGGPEPYNKESLERRKRRASRDKGNNYQITEVASPPPAAPDAPRPAPPISYKQTYKTGEQPTLQPGLGRSRSTQKPGHPVQSARPAPDNFNEGDRTEVRPVRREEPRESLRTDTDQQPNRNPPTRIPSQRNEIEKGILRRGSVDARKQRPELHDPSTEPQRRKESVSEAESQRRREWALDRSPLQRLELTLDSITKEEKRARVEEAEILAREKSVRRGDNSVHFRNRPITVPKSEQEVHPGASILSPTTIEQKTELHRVEVDKQGPVEINPQSHTQLDGGRTGLHQKQPSLTARQAERPVVPQRGQSLRERVIIPAAAVSAAGFVPVRRTSNRLKKEPPGDPWFNRRLEAERSTEGGLKRSTSGNNNQEIHADNSGTSVAPPSKMTTSTTGRVALADQKKRALVAHPLDPGDIDSNDGLDTVPVRNNSTKKIEQLTGYKLNAGLAMGGITLEQQQLYADRLDRSEELGPVLSSQSTDLSRQTTVTTVNGVKYAVPTAAAAGNFGQEQAALGPDGRHHFSNIVHGNRSHYRPGDGMYAPPRPLGEWKKSGVAFLGGALLDPEVQQSEEEKDKAWWEAGHTSKRRPSTSKPRKVETYDGGHENQNGIVISSLSDDTPEDIFDALGPIVHSITWRRGHERAVPLARHRIGFHGETRHHSKARQRNEAWRRLLKHSQSKSASSISRHPASIPLISPSSSLFPAISEQYPIYPSYIVPVMALEPGLKLTPSMRSIRVRHFTAPTSFQPSLYLKCGPLLRYRGMRFESLPARPGRANNGPKKEIWKGSIMIVTTDSKSSYRVAPTLRLFAQPKSLLPPPPTQVDGGADVAPEYVDPIAGLPKIGRDGRTLYVRPVEELEEEKDYSKDESDEGLFESLKPKSNAQSLGGLDGVAQDGPRAGKSVEVKGVRLHIEHGVTFWRFNIEVELIGQQQHIAYRINRGPSTGFWVPARGQSMNIMFHSCNGFSLSVNSDNFSGPDPMWRDVLNTHQTQPFHVMIGGGDQIYNDAVTTAESGFKEWLAIKNPLHKHNAPFTPQMQEELEVFYLDRYALWFSQGLFGLANSQIPMVNILDDHDIIDGFGSYPHHFMDSPVFAGLGAVAFKYYMLFQHQSVIDEGEDTEPSWILGQRPGPYIKELSRSVFLSLGKGVAFLGLDCRVERSRDDVISQETTDRILDRCERELIKGESKHLIVLLGVPIAYPRLVWLENILTSRLMDPVKALGRSGILGKGGLLNQFDGGVEILDDLDDHWTAKNHKSERNELVKDLQDLAADKSVRITILGGDVHLAAIGQFYSNPKLGIPKHKDHRYMPNIISSAIVNTPPPDLMADVLNKRNKVHHLDDFTDEDMIPIFTHDVNGAKRNNKHLLARRNWCSIREYNPELTPPATPVDERSPSPPTRVGLFRRLSKSRGPSYRPDTGPPVSRPPQSGGLMRRLSLSRGRPSTDSQRPEMRPRTLSLSRMDFIPALFRSRSKKHANSGGINGYGSESEDSYTPSEQPQALRLRGGAGEPSYFPLQAATQQWTTLSRNNTSGEESYAHKRPADISGVPVVQDDQFIRPRQFHRTPTGMSVKQRQKRGDTHDVNLEGGLDICLNVEVSQKDPSGITVPYRLLVPALFYNEDEDGERAHNRETKESGLKRLMSFGRGKGKPRQRQGSYSGSEVDEDE